MVGIASPAPIGDPGPDPRDERRALLRWTLAEGVGPRTLRAAVERAGSARALLGDREAAELLGVGTSPASPAEAEAVLAACGEHDVQVVGWGEPDYPDRLLHLEDPPPLLYRRGTLPDPARPSVALVGSRSASAYGRRTARSLARGLARHGVVVVSGMALGIDGEAHAGALEGEGTTVAVLGGGVERARPSSHRRLYREILARRGAVVGEWPPGTPARPFHFPRRNRILAALAGLVVVVEAGERSGALSTAAHGRRLGREVAAVPGPVDRPGHRGANLLLRDGCAPVLELRDLLDRVGVVPGPLGTGRSEPPSFAGDAAPVWRALETGPATVEEVATRVHLPPSRVLRALTRLEIEGWVRRERGVHIRVRSG